MAYQVIARKYRPQRFADVVGQEHVTQTLSNAIAQNRIAHAYLFVGPRGTGKTTIARIFAKCLNCSGGPKVDFDDQDPRCQEISEGRSLDVLEIDGASNRGIEEVRELRETVKYAPASAKFKIYIIDEVHMLTKEAFNALLKTLEEPPAHVKFMFATTEPEKVLPTILSRCQRFDLRRIPVPLIVKHLRHIAHQEQAEVDETALYAIARGAEGCMRDAESTLDQLISFCGGRIVEADVLSMFGLTAHRQLHELARAMLQGESAAVLRTIGELVHHGKDLQRLLTDLLGHFRRLLVLKIVAGNDPLVEMAEADAAALQEQAGMVTTEGLSRMLDTLVEVEGRLRDSMSKRIALEIGLLKTMEARQAVSIDTVLQTLRQLRDGGAPALAPGVPVAAINPIRSETHLPSPTTVSPAAVGVPNQEDAGAPGGQPPVSAAADAEPAGLAALWSGWLERVGQTSPFVRTYLQALQPVSWENQVLTIGIHPDAADQSELLDNTKNRNLMAAKLKEMGFDTAQVRFVKVAAPASATPVPEPSPPTQDIECAKVVASAPTPPPVTPKSRRSEKAAATPAPLDPQEFKNDPLIQKALEVFKGQIAGVQSSDVPG